MSDQYVDVREAAIVIASVFIGIWQQSFFAGMAAVIVLMLWETK